jgi:uncharacterized protein (TIGR03118 family)
MKRSSLCLLLAFSPHLLQAATGYLVHNLVADAPATAKADFYDPLLINPWGNVASATSPFWTCNNGTSTVYAVNATNATPLGTPNAALKPTVPGAGGKKGSCTGIVANIAPATTPPTFPVTAPGKAPVAAGFIFVTVDGVLSAWANGADPAQAFIQADNSAGSAYKGLALALTPSARLFAANFKTGNIDVFDSEFKPVNMPTGSFVDPRVPAGLAPFHIWTINGRLYVAYAKQDAARFFDVGGDGNGYVSVFDTSGRPFQSLVPGGAGSKLNSPWGLAIAPASFGKYANALLVGNFCDGLIDAYDATTGANLGTLQDPSGANIVLSGLWSIYFGNGANGGNKDTLYFTAGPGGQRRGILGSISANPNVTTSNVVSAGQPSGGISANTFLTIKGPHLVATMRSVTAADIVNRVLLTSLDGISATVDGKPAFITYISPV